MWALSFLFYHYYYYLLFLFWFRLSSVYSGDAFDFTELLTFSINHFCVLVFVRFV